MNSNMATNDRTADLSEAQEDLASEIAHHLAWVRAQSGAAAAAALLAKLQNQLAARDA